MFLNEIEITSSVVEGRVESLYVVFRKNETAKQTIAFQREDGAELFIDVDGRNVPIAIQIVESIEAPSQRAKISEDEIRAIVMNLFSFASMMVAYHEAKAQALGDELIREAVESAHRLTPAAA